MSVIAAISTPQATGGISMIRISGDEAFSVAEKVFRPLGSKKISEMAGYTCCYGKVFDGKEELDDAILTVYRAPKSYTGENVAEISCHGGIYITNRILRAVLSSGASPAGPGEFTRRAFLNGKLSLTQAEAVMDLISASGEQYHRCAVALREGALFLRIQKVKNSLISTLGSLAAWVDYPEEDIPEVENQNLLNTLAENIEELQRLSDTYDGGKILREGIKTVIVGKPNAGKSTLMNFFAGCERSIVTEIAGTTRDVVEETVRFGNLILRLFDTAGIRKTDDIVESAGISLTMKKLQEADLVLAVFDNSALLSVEDNDVIEKAAGKRSVALLNKSDKTSAFQKEALEAKFSAVIEISAKDGTGMEKLHEILEDLFKTGGLDPSAGILANERQKQCAENARNSLKNAYDALAFGETLDAVTILIDEAAGYLLELTGEMVSEEVVEQVFSHFCVGK